MPDQETPRRIKVLDKATISRIAAGEVVERPLSVCKELVENSMDANATSIEVELKDGGISFIKVSDNGSGIPQEELKAAFLEHATSKIQTPLDLENVLTMGFRGEALASVAAVAHVELLSKPKSQEAGAWIEIKGSEVISQGFAGTGDGTEIIVRNLFFNTPARLKFLKKPSAEAGLVSDLMNKLALSRPDIAFRLISNGQTILSTNGSGNLRTTASLLFGADFAKKLVPIFAEKSSMKLTGLLGKPEQARASRSSQSLFVNRRHVKCECMQKAIEEGYGTLLMGGKFPAFILDLSLPPNLVDANAHPNKLEVRFQREDEVVSFTREAIVEALSKFSMMPEVSAQKAAFQAQLPVAPVSVQELHAPVPVPQVPVPATPPLAAPPLQVPVPAMPPLPSQTSQVAEVPQVPQVPATPPFAMPPFEVSQVPPAPPLNTPPAPKPLAKASPRQLLSAREIQEYSAILSGEGPPAANRKPADILPYDLGEEPPLSRALSGSKIIGQFFGTYWIVEHYDSIYVIDQHAAHERVLFERLLQRFNEGCPASQQLLSPQGFRLTPREMDLVVENASLLEGFGFAMKKTSDIEISITAVPYMLGKPQPAELFLEILDKLGDMTELPNAYELKKDAVATMACKAAVKANDKLGQSEAEALVKELLELENPFTCPHGRPTIVEMTKREWEKKFKRVN
ncbi:MAG: DNA mismatch repair endonuclease MutL [Clostridiales bacterium]|jgi:DNA mismatch repair protein MutL|nr:DNA mismatch repair endonuclease MutL [Clostridiales bacterium]MDR2751075.1 DNA mismatch repair endonuclease MutL [Clostridiales bacterium]